VIGWIKRNLLVVVFLVLVVVSLPSAWFFSGRLNAGLRERQQSDAEADLNALKRGNYTYQIAAREPGEEPLTFQAPPNPKITAWFAEQSKLLEDDADEVVTRAVSFNRRGHSVLVDGLFPEPANPTQGQYLAVNMVKLLVGDNAPSEYERMLAKAGAGKPLDPDDLGMTLSDRRELEEQRLLAETGEAQLTAEQKDQVQQTLVNERIHEYERRAREISFYAEPSAITEPVRQNSVVGDSLPPTSVPSQPPEIDTCFVWQFDLWVIQDILDAITLANTGDDGRPLGVEDAAVKRLLHLSIDALTGSSTDTGGTGGGGPPPYPGDPRNRGGYGQPDPRLSPPSAPYGGGEPDDTAPAPAPDGVAPIDLQRSITGRFSSKQNQLYDVRTVHLDVIVASDKLPRLYDALSKVNFMTVLGVDINEIDPWSDLREGYYYGTDNVVRATLTIETLWLRDWTVPLMPDGIIARLGVVKPEPDQDG